MPSTFSWLDYSDHERRQVLDVIELFGEKTTIDELGIGSVRDAFADSWFPGTSTIQTTAKYFLLVPWSYVSLENRSIGSDRIAEYARRLEIRTIQSLIDSGATNGVIGRIARESLQRLPSGVYWQGLGTWGIRTCEGSQDVYHRSLDSFYAQRKAIKNRHVEFEGESPELNIGNWDPELPPVPTEFPDGVSMDLSSKEADYLRHRIVNSCRSSLLAYLFQKNISVTDERFVWDIELSLSEELQRQVFHGRLFSEVIHGAQLLYNVILAELKNWDEQVERFREAWNEWANNVEVRRTDIAHWNIPEFWTIVCANKQPVGDRVKEFINSWIDLVRSAPVVDSLYENVHARDLIKVRERQIKKGLARVLGGRPLELWGGESGTSQLDFRWRNARRIYLDIQRGMENR